MGEVGENGDFDRDAEGAELGEGVRGGFEDEKFSTGVGDSADALVENVELIDDPPTIKRDAVANDRGSTSGTGVR